jgi:predicted acylesterase/phospholipase RssA
VGYGRVRGTELTPTDSEDPQVTRGKRVARGEVELSAEEMFQLALALIDKHQAFGVARRLLRLAREKGLPEELQLKARQKHALSTYRDPDAPVGPRLDRALEILGEDCDPLEETTNQETLGQAGAIYMRKWEAGARVGDLERAFMYYDRGRRGGLDDDGDTAINAAFVLDLLADLEERESEATTGSGSTPGATGRRHEAIQIRRHLLRKLKRRARRPAGSQSWWLQMTLAEAAFGTGNYAAAKQWVTRASAVTVRPQDWQVETVARQLGAIARLNSTDASREIAPAAKEVLKELLGGSSAAVTHAYVGKVGLALSGGGFRASFFHIGVLARLAERDLLRHVEVLSCVSGGSIVGAHYYLEVKQLLESDHAKGGLSRDDYVTLVRNVEDAFLAGVRSNVRMRVIGSFPTHLVSMVSRKTTRTMRAGELYESKLFKRVDGKKKRFMHELKVRPADIEDEAERSKFTPRAGNWRRDAKVPMLVLNAASLNTGHNWQFTASWMGEPPAVGAQDVDSIPRLRRMYYGEAPERWRCKVRLGHAVAASACVPGLFEPVALPKLYPDTTVQLVDGGVHDNQGVASLIEQECSVMLVSDASGQMTEQAHLASGPLSVPLRSSHILSARVREAQLRDLVARRSASVLRGLMLVHLRKGLDRPPRDWLDSDDPYVPGDDVVPQPAHDYGIEPEVQRRLAAIRTDLDAFSDMEAKALMWCGYRMAATEIERSVSGFPLEKPLEAPPWKFFEVKDSLRPQSSDHAQLLKVLDAGSRRWGKLLALYKSVRWAAIIVGLIAAVAALHWLWTVRGDSILTAWEVLVAVAIVVATTLIGRLLKLSIPTLLYRFGVGLALALVAVPALICMLAGDWLYQRAGKVG